MTEEKERNVYRRLGLQDVIIEQIATVAAAVSSGKDSTNAIGALHVLCSPYLSGLEEWKKKWEGRRVQHVKDEESGDSIPVPTGEDNLLAFGLLMDGLSEAGVLFERVKVSYVGEPEKEKGSEPAVVSGGVGSDIANGTGPIMPPAGDVGGSLPARDVVRPRPPRAPAIRGGLRGRILDEKSRNGETEKYEGDEG